MKIKAILVFTILSVLSCNTIDEINTFAITKDFDDSISISETTDGLTPGSWSETIVFDAASSPEVQANIDRFRDARLNSFSFEIVNYIGSENAVMTGATLAFGDIVIPIEDINLKEADDNNTIFTIGTTSDYQAFADILKRDLIITIIFSGNVTDTPVSFDINVIADTTIILEAV